MGGIHRVVVSGTIYSQLWQNRFYIKNGNEGPGITDEEICNHFLVNWVEWVRKPLINDVKFLSIESKAIGSGAGFTLPIAKAGGQLVDNQSITFMAGVLRFQTALAGRKHRGRCYIPGVSLGQWTNGQINANGIAAWTETLAKLNERFVEGGEFADIWLVIHGETESHDTTVTRVFLRPILGCQRRRNIGVGS